METKFERRQRMAREASEMLIPNKDKPRAAHTRPNDQLIMCQCDWLDGYCHYLPKPINCRGPHISERRLEPRRFTVYYAVFIYIVVGAIGSVVVNWLVNGA